jgi:hypothetical protein
MTPSASLLQHLDHADSDSDVDVDMTIAPDEWAFFPAPASRIRKRGRLKLIKSSRDAGPAVADTLQDVAVEAEPAAEELAAAEPAPEEPLVQEAAAEEPAAAEVSPAPTRAAPVRPVAPVARVALVAPVAPVRFADDAMSDVDVTDIDEATTDEEPKSPDASLSFESIGDDEPVTPDEEPMFDDEPTSDAEPSLVDEPAPVAEVTALAETDEAVEPSVVDEPSAESAQHMTDATDVKQSPRKPAQRKPAARKPAKRKPAKPKATRKASGSRPSATDLLHAARQPKTEVVAVENAASAPPATDGTPASKGSTKRVLVAALAVVVIAAGAVVGFLVMRDGTPASPRPAGVDIVTRYAQGSGGVTDGSELGFRAVFPGSPERDSAQLRGPDENTTVRYEWLSFRSGDVEFNAGRIAYPDDLDVSDSSQVLRKAADGSARTHHGKVESYREMTVNGDPAAESVVSTSDGAYLRTHAVLHGQTLYLVRVASDGQTQPGFERFADSFEVI